MQTLAHLLGSHALPADDAAAVGIEDDAETLRATGCCAWSAMERSTEPMPTLPLATC